MPLENDTVLNSLGTRTTTNPTQLAPRTRHRPVVKFTTYASLLNHKDPKH
ncbi:hypothetical protein [Streptomyces sp. NPDC003032]